MRIKRHDNCHIVELSDDSTWHIWPGDLAKTLAWLPTTDLDLIRVEHDICSHALVDRSDGVSVMASETDAEWPFDAVRQLLATPNNAHLRDRSAT